MVNSNRTGEQRPLLRVNKHQWGVQTRRKGPPE